MIDFWESLLRTLCALAIVLGLMGVMAMAARRLFRERLGTPDRQALIHVVASGYIAPRKTIALVSVAGDYLIIGATSTDLVPLGRVSDAGKVEQWLASAARDPARSASLIPSPMSRGWLQWLSMKSFPSRRENYGGD